MLTSIETIKDTLNRGALSIEQLPFGEYDRRDLTRCGRQFLVYDNVLETRILHHLVEGIAKPCLEFGLILGRTGGQPGFEYLK